MTLLEVKNLKKTYTTRLGGHLVPALTNVNFSVEKGEYLAIMGESGSGKTTLLNIVASLDQPTSGQVLLEGKELGKIRERDLAAFRRDNLGFVFQDFNLLDTFSLKDNILLPLVLSGMAYGEMTKRLMPLAKKLGIEDILEKYPYEVSGGQKQRAAVARACITQPRLLLADEPTGALDSRAANQLLDLFGQINKEGQTILMVTHSAKAASRAERVLFIKDGAVFHQLYRGGRSDEAMFAQIADTLTALTVGVRNVGKLFFPRIAAGNLVRNRRFFFPYLLTGLLTVAMFYNVAFLTWNKDLKEMPGGDTLTIIMYFGTIVVGIFAVVFLLYTNSFLVKRRQKELGLYNILGMSKGHIAVVMLWETLYTGLITIAGGLLLGILLSKLLMLLLFKILFFTVQFGFVVNAFPVVVTVVLFAGIYLLALAKNLLHVRLSKPVELLKGSNVGEREPKTKKLLVALGVLTLGAGYAIAITVKSPLDALTLFFLAVILVIVGTYCLFTAGSIALLKGMKRRKNYYYQPKHFIGISGMLYRMKQNAVGLANICILSTMVLVMLSTCVCMYMGVDNAMKTLYPHDITVSQPWIDQKNHSKEESRKLVMDTTKKTGLTPTSIQEIDTIRTVVESKDTSVFLPADREASASDLIYAEAITAESYAHITGEKFSLESGEVALYTTEKDADWKEISFLDTPFQIVKKLEEPPMVGGGGYSDHKIVLVVANETVLEQIYQQQFQYPDSITSNVYWELSMDFETASNQEIEALYGDLRQMNAELEGNYLFDCRPAQSAQFYSLYGGLLFLGIFLGALFLMATVLIIYYKQISEGYDDKERFAIMEKVGMSQQQVRSAIRSQVRTVFFLPLVGAVIHLAAAFKMITKLMAALSLTNIPLFALTCLGTVAVFAVGYLVIYALTARTYYKIVR